MAKAWKFENEYWDYDTGEKIPEPEYKIGQYIKKYLKTTTKYHGQFNIKTRIYVIRKLGKQQSLW